MKGHAIVVASLLLSCSILHSCKRELSCESCRETNKPPIANAGRDTVVSFPSDAVVLDGSASIDPDGSIVSYEWSKISGPSTPLLYQPGQSKASVKLLVAGVYQFELTVMDNGGLKSKDTVFVSANGASTINQPPIAKAGQDFSITLPFNTASLDGSASSDPENNIASYTWTKIEGPTSFSIANSSGVITEATNLLEGNYLFELKVTDGAGLFSRDTVKVTVKAATTSTACDNSNRPLISARLIPLGTLSQAGSYLSVGATGSKIVFTGRQSETPTVGIDPLRVDIYDIVTNTWSTAQLSVGRYLIAIVAAGNKLFFGGGERGDGTSPTNAVDIFDVSTNTWSTAALSTAGHSIAGATVGNKVFFAGGDGGFYGPGRSSRVDIYDLTTDIWSTRSLSEPKEFVTAVTANNKVYFAGGVTHWIDPSNGTYHYSVSSLIDIYDNATNSWSTSTMQQGKMAYAALSVSNKIYWAGGIQTYGGQQTCSVEIRDATTGPSSTQSLSKPGQWAPDMGQNPVVKDNKIVFFRTNGIDNKEFDIYDIASNSWSIGVLPVSIEGASIISVNNIVYVAGGRVNGTLSKQVWKLEF